MNDRLKSYMKRRKSATAFREDLRDEEARDEAHARMARNKRAVNLGSRTLGVTAERVVSDDTLAAVTQRTVQGLRDSGILAALCDPAIETSLVGRLKHGEVRHPKHDAAENEELLNEAVRLAVENTMNDLGIEVEPVQSTEVIS